MAMSFSAGTFNPTDPTLPSAGSGIATTLGKDFVSDTTQYFVGNYNATYGSSCGCQFGPNSSMVPAPGGAARPEGINIFAAMSLYMNPFVVDQLARFPLVADTIEHAYVNLSRGAGDTMAKKTRTITYNAGTKTVDTTVTAANPSGAIGVCGLFDEAGDIIPRLLGTTINTGALDSGVFDIADQVDLMRKHSTGNCIGFTWLLMPMAFDIDEVAEGTEGTLAAMMSSMSNSSMHIDGDGFYEGTASVTWIEWTSGYGWSNGGIQISEYAGSLLMPSGSPPRMD